MNKINKFIFRYIYLYAKPIVTVILICLVSIMGFFFIQNMQIDKQLDYKLKMEIKRQEMLIQNNNKIRNNIIKEIR